jgi:hypothetical protein
MRSIGSLRDLDSYGIHILTGEADALGYRILCDLTEGGRELVAAAWGITILGFHENWNHGSENCPHVASVMLTMEAWRAIGPVALHLRNQCHTIFDTDKGTIFGLDAGESIEREEGRWDHATNDYLCLTPAKLTRDGETMTWLSSAYGKIQRFYTIGTNPHVGLRNVHAMTGRVE